MFSELLYVFIECLNNLSWQVFTILKAVRRWSNRWERPWRWRILRRIVHRSNLLRAWKTLPTSLFTTSRAAFINKVSERIPPILRILAAQSRNIPTHVSLTIWLSGLVVAWGRPSSHFHILALILGTLHFYCLTFIRYIFSIPRTLVVVLVILTCNCWAGRRYSRMETQRCRNADVRIAEPASLVIVQLGQIDRSVEVLTQICWDMKVWALLVPVVCFADIAHAEDFSRSAVLPFELFAEFHQIILLWVNWWYCHHSLT